MVKLSLESSRKSLRALSDNTSTRHTSVANGTLARLALQGAWRVSGYGMSSFDLVFRNTTKNHRFSQKFFERILAAAAKKMGLKKGIYEISIALVGEQRIRSLNKKYRRKDKVTDVLSFPLGAESLTGYNTKALGDLFLCVPFAIRAAKHENMPLDEKLAWMTVHGLLHLAGYDHERSDHESEAMAALEKKILSDIT